MKKYIYIYRYLNKEYHKYFYLDKKKDERFHKICRILQKIENLILKKCIK